MARYTEEQRQRNQRTITFAVVFGLLVVALLALLSGNTRSALGVAVLVLATGAVAWWLFAAKNAGTIDGEWVDGWNHEGHTKQGAVFGYDPDAPGVPRRRQEPEAQEEP